MAIHDYTPKDITRFWSKVNKNGTIPEHRPELGACWEWQAGCFKSGYGQIGIKRKMLLSHRVVWELSNGEIPDGMWVLHSCDNRRCCNPLHLFLGTPLDNTKDMFSKGRHHPGDNSGEKHGNHKLTAEQVLSIRQFYANGTLTVSELATRFSVTRENIRIIVKRKGWKGV